MSSAVGISCLQAGEVFKFVIPSAFNSSMGLPNLGLLLMRLKAFLYSELTLFLTYFLMSLSSSLALSRMTIL